ncbi:MAG: aspartate ammonia-lyase [Anaerolineales bacterium]
MSTFRIEHDLLGEREVPAQRYYGIQTLRALENFHITGIPLFHYPHLIQALAYVKKAAAQANAQLGLLDESIAHAIVQACDEVIAGQWNTEFAVDILQGGAGTSTNMNANEVIANRALEILGYEKGRYDIIHPNTHVNMAQSTNDVFPTALRLALYISLAGLLDSMNVLRADFEAKAAEFADVLKVGRTQLQDAVPITLGQEFAAYATMLSEDIQRVEEARSLIREINLGGTAIGTSLNADPEYPRLATEILRRATNIPLILAENLVEATQDTGAYVQLSGVLKRVAVKLSKICNDLRLMASGPRAGLGEINLPRMAPGSSIMPGKVNPIIPEVVNQVAFQVVGNDVAITMAAEAGQLELNVMEPVIAYNLFNSIDMLRRAALTLAERAVRGITANAAHTRRMVEESIGLATALNPVLGYEKASEVARLALESGRNVTDIVLEKGYLTPEELTELLRPENMVRPRPLRRA